METLLLIGLITGLAGGVAATVYFFNLKSKKEVENQSVLILEKIKQVCKLITVEGEFSEIFTHRDAKKYMFNIFQSEKKALIIVKAKVLVGFDLSKINVNINKNIKQVSLSSFPAPEIMSIETDLEYYDFQKGMINKYTEGDLTEMNKKTKEFIREKATQSHLIQLADHQSSETISIIKHLIESVGWEMGSEKMLENGQGVQNKLQE